MKRIIVGLSLIIGSIYTTSAQQIADNAIGLRFGGGNGVGGEISYQKALGENNRLEVNLGLANEFTNFKATGLYEWVWNIEEQFNWYAGFGGGIVSANGTGIYGAGVIDNTGLEKFQEASYQGILHFYQVPFYYIEYGFAQLGAIAMWRNFKSNKQKAIQAYKNALSLGYTRSIPEIYQTADIQFVT